MSSIFFKLPSTKSWGCFWPTVQKNRSQKPAYKGIRDVNKLLNNNDNNNNKNKNPEWKAI